ncbi:serine hydrolase domain-containing protein [Paenibacillus sp. sgz500958]|uniref:serine hydrolase domain-containing protein n=1 Tax=Paenibacillus sp. sgz500958 TaxID=3242475 RepID=UPI0036D239AE
MVFISTWNVQPLVNVMTGLDTRSCLIVHQNQVVLEYYRKPQYREEPGKINSCTKSVLSTLIGIAMEQQLFPYPETPIYEYFPMLKDESDARKRTFTIDHLLTMTAGFAWNEFGGLNSFPAMSHTPDWVQYVLTQPMAEDPGSKMVYSSGCSQLLSAILQQTTGQTAADFAEEQLFRHLGIEDYHWETDPQGIHTGGFGLYLKPWDMVKFGQLYLGQGTFEGRRLLTPDTIREFTAPRIETEAPQKAQYGRHWWISSFATGEEKSDKEIPYYYALGFGGQYIIVVPSFELVVVITADSTKKKRTKVDLFRQHIVPLLLNSATS